MSIANGKIVSSNNLFNWIRYSGVWVGFVLNPFHWSFKWERESKEWPNDNVFENCLHLGPIWVRVIIDDGRW